MVERINDAKTNVRAHFVETFSITVGAVILIMNEFLPLLKKCTPAGEPRIINVTSQTGSSSHAAATDYFLTDQMGYSVAKAALNRVTIDYKKMHPDVAFYLACPGYCKTFLNLYQGFKDPYDGAKIVEDLVVAEKGKYPFGFYAFENGELLEYDW
jgi:NAD(P)-dependent dehydrogenase (short-subunit alcohol dehydrogenase family)